jgi:Branched-chain amino acid ABC-type transport system, permease components
LLENRGMNVWLLQALNGLSYGMLLFLLAAGLTLTFGLLRIVNLTHGSFYLLGGYAGLAVVQATDNFLLAVLAGALTAAFWELSSSASCSAALRVTSCRR